MLTFTQSEVSRFEHRNKSLRWGQAFYNFMKLHKVQNQQDKEYCDRLYNEQNDERAKAMVQGRTDFSQHGQLPSCLLCQKGMSHSNCTTY